MQSLRIDTGSIKLAINEDPNRVIEFNPNDISFIERFYGLITDFEEKEKEYTERLEKLGKNKEVDSLGIPKNLDEGLVILRDICDFMRGRIDHVFGDAASQKAFGDANTLNMFEQFLDGVTPYIQNARTGKVQKYTGNREQRRAAVKVMK